MISFQVILEAIPEILSQITLYLTLGEDKKCLTSGMTILHLRLEVTPGIVSQVTLYLTLREAMISLIILQARQLIPTVV